MRRGSYHRQATDANRDLDIPAALNQFAFNDPTGVMGQIAYDAGRVHRLFETARQHNGAVTVYALYANLDALRTDHWVNGAQQPPLYLDPADLHRAIAAMADQIAKLTQSQPADPRVVAEYRTSMRLWQHGAKRLLIAQDDPTYSLDQMAAELRELRAEYVTNWLSRNRPGGLADSLTRLDRLAADYAPRTEPVQS